MQHIQRRMSLFCSNAFFLGLILFGSVTVWAHMDDEEKAMLDTRLYELNDLINQDPRLSSPYISRGLIFIKRSEFDRALVDFNNALRVSPDLAVGFFCRGLAYAGKNSLNEAIADFTKAIEIESDMGGAYYNRAVAYFGLKNYSEALNDLKKAKELNVEIEHEFEESLMSHIPPQSSNT